MISGFSKPLKSFGKNETKVSESTLFIQADTYW